MIKALSLKNFQSHKETRLDLHPGINSIIGTSDSGKSAVLRGLNWIINNRPSGDGFISYWAKDDKGKLVEEANATLFLENGETISRSKNKDFNGYVLNDEDVFEAIRTDVPEEISKALNITEVNFQKQTAAPFLISETSGEIARFLNRLINLDSIDVALKSIAAKKKAVKQKISTSQDNLEKYKNDKEKLQWVSTFGEKIKAAEKVHKEIEKIDNLLFLLNSSVNHYKALSREKKNQIPIIGLENSLNRIIEIGEKMKDVSWDLIKIKEDKSKYSELSGIKTDSIKYINLEAPVEKVTKINEKLVNITENVDNLTENVDNYKKNKRILLEWKKYAGIVENDSIGRVVELNDTIETFSEKINLLKTGIISYNKLKDIIETTGGEIERYENELPDICPTCNGTGRLK
jgi:exonuclease SbcC